MGFGSDPLCLVGSERIWLLVLKWREEAEWLSAYRDALDMGGTEGGLLEDVYCQVRVMPSEFEEN